MNKFGVVFGVAAVAVIAGCKDPDYHRAGSTPVQNEVKPAEAVEAPAETAPVAAAPAAEPAPIVASAPVAEKREPERKQAAAAEPETTVYIVQNGDSLSKISKKFNVTIASIRRLNGLKSDSIRIGQKLKLPGKLDVGVQKAPATAQGGKKSSKQSVAYTGATREYTVRSGDTLGAIAYGNGINIRQLKELNGLTSDLVRVGQKLKVPADGKKAKAESKKSTAVAAKKPEEKTVAAPAAAPVAKPVAPVAAEAAPAPAAETPASVAEPAASAPDAETAAPAAEAAAEAVAPEKAAVQTISYVVQEGDDMTGVSIRFGVTSAEIRELNNLGENEQLVPGTTIKLPADTQE